MLAERDGLFHELTQITVVECKDNNFQHEDGVNALNTPSRSAEMITTLVDIKLDKLSLMK